MAVVTLSRQYASGGSDIARLVADALGWTLVDNQFVDKVAERAGMSRAEVAQREERSPGLIERLARALAVSSPEVFAATGEAPAAVGTEDTLVATTERVIAETVQHGDVVMVGRGAQAYLAEHGATLHVLIVAPREARIQAALDRLGISRKEAERSVDEIDEGRRRYVKTHYGREWGHPANYDLCLNSATLGYRGCADLIVAAVRGRGLGDPAG